MFISKRKIAGILAGLMLTSLTSCGEPEKEPYVSPSFENESSENQKYEKSDLETVVVDATPGDAVVYDAAPTDKEIPDSVKASLTDAVQAGFYDGNTYYNTLGGFQISTEGTSWSFYDAEGVANATGLSVDDINNFWYGYKSAYDSEISYGCIAYDVKTGSNVMVSYVNPDVKLLPTITAEDYLAMALGRYQDLVVKRVGFMGGLWACLDIPEEQTGVGRRVCYAVRKENLIVLVTFTMQEGQELSEAQSIFTRISE